ncbi:MAG: M1 family peptidase, partial [Ginsengibacter sp.]
YFNAMNTGSGQNLNWFFQNWFFTNNYIDLKINNAKKQNGFYNLAIENVGGFAIPFDVKVTYADGTTSLMHETPAIWKTNEEMQVIKISDKKNISSIELDNGIFLDFTPGDNIWKG